MKIIDLKTNRTSFVISAAVACLNSGGLVIYPTETLYGAGVNATNQTAVNKLLAYKSRREGKPLSIAVTDQNMAKKYVVINQQATDLYQKFLPGPYTIISQNKNTIAKGVASEFNTLGIRIPDYRLIIKIVEQLKKPITATSANTSGKKRPYSIADILQNTSKKQQNLIDLVIDAGTLPHNPSSTVIDTTLSTPLTLRDNQQNKKNTQVLIGNNEEETKQIAGKLLLKHWSQIKKSGLLIGLNGELGAGKTIFAKGLGKFLGIKQPITSPTYTYIKEYPYHRYLTEGFFFHIDTWKIDSQEQLDTLKLEKLFKKNNIVAIEWWTQIKQFMPELEVPRLIIDFEVIDQQKRQLIIYEA